MRDSNYEIKIPEAFHKMLKEKYDISLYSHNPAIKIAKINLEMATELFDLTEENKKKFMKYRMDLTGIISSFKGNDEPCKKLRHLPLFILRAFTHLNKKWFFKTNNADGQLLAYYLSAVKYIPRSEQNPESIKITFSYSYRGKIYTEVENIHTEFLRKKFLGKKFKNGLTANEVLQNLGYTQESEELFKKYEESNTKYLSIKPEIGIQYWAIGNAKEAEGYRSNWITLERESGKSRFLADDTFPESSNSGHSSSKTPFLDLDYWKEKIETFNGDPLELEDEEEEEIPEIPNHHYIHGFNLDKHQFIQIHTNNLTKYEFNNTLSQKLILPQEIKELNNLLMSGGDSSIGDIIEGKSQGTLILASGGPGRGKTLTAEVFSESISRPLYVVNCSQLGIEIEEIEKKLTEVLYRNRRWNAILLFDEADVYIHERGKDLTQNAIVGVFLRALERFAGVLFMTTNRATSVDDAILSRTTVHIRYPLPSVKDIPKIWRVQAEVQGVKLSENLIKQFTEEFPIISGRDIRGLLRLGVQIAKSQNKNKLTLNIMKSAIKYKDLAKQDEPTIEIKSQTTT